MDCILAIERPGPTKDGLYKTMRNLDLGEYLAPIDRILKYKTPQT